MFSVFFGAGQQFVERDKNHDSGNDTQDNSIENRIPKRHRNRSEQCAQRFRNQDARKAKGFLRLPVEW